MSATRVLSREERHRAIKEADSILRLGKKWQRQVPNERRPNFEATAAAILRKALSSHVESGKRVPLKIIDNGMQHHHGRREARLLERTFKASSLPQEVLHSFQTGSVRRDPKPVRRNRGPDPEYLPRFDLYQHDTVHRMPPGHYDVRARKYQNYMHDMHPAEMSKHLTPAFMPRVKVPGGTEELHT